jgi:DNA-binding GntR family transcriptional regulator
MKSESHMPSDIDNNTFSDPDERLIVERIFKAVMEQRLAPNTKLSESRLCETFGVGRMRVRRALLLLSSQGIVDLQSNRGAYVACPNHADAKDVFEARMLIEPPLVRKLAQAPTAFDLSVLTQHIEQENSARAHKERTEIIRLSGEFHVKVAQATGNHIISKILRELVTRTSLIVGLFGSSENASCPDDEHANILDAIQSQAPDRAEALLITHLEHIQSGLNMEKPQAPQDDLSIILGVSR